MIITSERQRHSMLKFERQRDLLCQCWDVIANEPSSVRRERLRLEIEPWREALRECERHGWDQSAQAYRNRLRDFLQRETVRQ